MVGAIRVVIVEGQRLFREALSALLSREEEIEIVGEVAPGSQTIPLIEHVKPDVVLVDIGMPGADGIGLIRAIRQKSPEARSLILCAAREEGTIGQALKAGARGYVSKDATVSELRKAIRGVHKGEVWVERSLVPRLLGADTDGRGAGGPGGPKGALTPREQGILRSLASGGTNKEIAQALGISEKTVKTHLNSIFRKLHIARRLQAVLYAIQQGMG